MRILTVALIFAFTGAHAHDPAAQATYLGNEGVLVSNGDTKIVFDAFYADSYGQYALVPDAISEALIAGTPPYDGVDAIFVSHVHGDHFTPEPAIEFLRAHENVRLYGAQQIRDALANAVDADDPVLKQVVVIEIERGGAPLTLRDGDVELDAYYIPHAGWPDRADIQNIAFRLTLDDDVTVMHFGDADPSDAHFAAYQEDFDKRKTDMAMPPYWYFQSPDGRQILDDRIRPTTAVGVHVPARAGGNGDAWREVFDADLFTDPGETREIGAPAQ